MLALATVALEAGEPVRSVISTLEAGLLARWLEDMLPSGSQAIAVLDSTGAVIASTGPYTAQLQPFAPWIREYRVTLNQAPFQLVIQSNALVLRLPSMVAWITLLLGLGLATTLGLAASRQLAKRLQDDLKSLTPSQQGLSRTLACTEADAVAQELTHEHTAKQALLDRLEDQERVQWDILHQLPAPVLVSRDGRVVQANEQAERLFGTSADQLIGQPSADFLHPDERQRVLPLLAHVRSTPGARERMVTRIIRGDGVVQGIEVAMVRLEHGDGPLVLSVLRLVSVGQESCTGLGS
jgi:PAS domain S-box-containing protein